jgi:GT2 family glycosyltransferase
VYNDLGGFSEMRFGEDIDLSTRIFKGGYACRLFPEAWVWHKRRTDLKKFFKQVHNSGIARINLTKRHPGTLKLVHLLPTVFTLGVVMCLLTALCGLLLPIISIIGISPLLLFSLIIFIDASVAERSMGVGIRAVAASYVQLTGYGTGFLRAWWERCVLGRGEFEAFKKNFYK